MSDRTILVGLSLLLTLALASCSGDDGAAPTAPDTPGGGHDSIFAQFSFADYGAAARRVLPPAYSVDQVKVVVDDLWHDGQFALLGKVFSAHEPMSIHRNIDDHDDMMQTIEFMQAALAGYEAENGEIPDGPFAFTHPQFGSGTLTVRMLAAEEPVPVPAVCRTVFGCAEVAVDYLLQIDCDMDGGEDWSSPYFGFSASDEAQVLYYWDVDRDEEMAVNGSRLFLARKDVAADTFEIAGATFKPDGPGDEERCNWVYRLTGNAEFEFTYNMGWYAESPEFELFGCVQGSGDKDVEFGLRYHQYTGAGGWDAIDEQFVSERVFGPVGDDPYAFLDEPSRGVADYVDAAIMYVVGDSPLAEIPNPFLEFLQ